MMFYADVHRTKYLWNVIIVNQDCDNEMVAFSSYKTFEEAEAWGEGFIKAIEVIGAFGIDLILKEQEESQKKDKDNS